MKTLVLHFVCDHVEVNTSSRVLQIMHKGFSMGCYICMKRYVICIMCVRNSFGGISSAFLCFLCKAIYFLLESTQLRHIINRYRANLFLCRTPATMSKKSVSPSGERNLIFILLLSIIMAVTVFWKPLAVREIRCLGEIYKQEYSFYI